ncbi:hypothetical protein A0H81_13002 [Grifola frondosa]|uniref:Uncharacterized protein n=1 Tax=Grifola frondosa TaxID=5627 RepID=A0A1C7LR99_GRIFR|nr:hypothetical protein A0H81_13002 [Grifola frondosa]
MRWSPILEAGSSSSIVAMSFIKASNLVFARDLWPSQIGRPIRDHDDADTLPMWRVMPHDFDELCGWAVVEGDTSAHEGARRTVVVYDPLVHQGRNGSMCQVTVRLQGFIESVNLNPLGNWSGRDHDAPGAVQFVTLSGGGFVPPFLAQQDVMCNLRALVMGALGIQSGYAAAESGVIELKRRVFTRDVVRLSAASELKANVRAVMDSHNAHTDRFGMEEGASGFYYDMDPTYVAVPETPEPSTHEDEDVELDDMLEDF